MKSDIRKIPLSHIMTLVKKDFLGPSPQRHWFRLAWVYVKCVVFGGFWICGLLGSMVLGSMVFIPDALATDLSRLSQGELVALMQTIWSGLISAILTIGLPACMMFAVLITLERYLKVLKNEAF